jgi:prophage antirepressor-like protein
MKELISSKYKNMMNGNLRVFKNTELEKITTFDINGEPWFASDDVTTSLGYTTTDKMLMGLDVDYKQVKKICTSGQTKEISIINELGLIDAIIRSQSPEASKFKEWVADEFMSTANANGEFKIDFKQFVDLFYSHLPEDAKSIIAQTLSRREMLLEENRALLSIINELETDNASLVKKNRKLTKLNNTFVKTK